MPTNEVSVVKSLRIQSVFYGNKKADVEYSLIHLLNAIKIARSLSLFSSVTVAFGDCSSAPIFSQEEINAKYYEAQKSGVDSIVYEYFDANLGSAGGHNRLLKNLHEDYVLILNPDTVVSPDIFAELLLPFSDPAVAAVEAKQIPIEHPKDYAESTGETGWISTACALVRSSAVKAVNGFDSNTFFLYCDDVDFSWRLRLLGYKLIFQSTAAIFHDKRLSIDGGWIAGEAERYHAALAAMLLTYKYSRNDLTKRIQADLALNGDTLQQKAAADFKIKQEDGRLPSQIDTEHRVAEFINGVYTSHRF